MQENSNLQWTYFKGGVNPNRMRLLVSGSNLPLRLTETTFQIKTTWGPYEGGQVWG